MQCVCQAYLAATSDFAAVSSDTMSTLAVAFGKCICTMYMYADIHAQVCLAVLYHCAGLRGDEIPGSWG